MVRGEGGALVAVQDAGEALDRSSGVGLQGAIQQFVVEGVKTNLPLHRRIAASESFARGELSTRFLESLPPETPRRPA